MKKLFAFLVISVFVLSPITASAEDSIVDPMAEYWTPDQWRVSTGSVGVGHVEPEAPPLALWVMSRDPSGPNENGLCVEMGEAPCTLEQLTSKRIRVDASYLLPLCESEKSPDCVESVMFRDGLGHEVQGEFIRAVAGPSADKVAKFKFPKTGTQLLFRAPGILNAAGTDTYAVLYIQSLEYLGKATPRSQTLQVTVVPYVEVEDSNAVTQDIKRNPKGSKTLYSPVGDGLSGGTVFVEQGKRGLKANFADQTQVSVTIHASADFDGWFRGRFSNAQIDIKEISKTQQSITVDGEAVLVPRIFASVGRANWSKYMDLPIDVFNQMRGGLVTTGVSDPLGNFVWLKAIKASSDDTAMGVNRVWMFATVDQPIETGCYKAKGVQGIVATNAAVYGSGAPNYSGGFLNYKVGGLHYLPDGTEAIGNYDLVMRSDIARCLYKFNSAPVSGTITVSGEGDTKIATTTVGEKNGWLKLSANGFTFSSKTIKVKLTQKKTTITCVATANPKKTKKVTGYSPKCPTGYKKK